MTLVMHENGVLVVHLVVVKDKNPRRGGPSVTGAVAGVEGTCASNPQQDSEKLEEKQEEEKHDDNGSHEEDEEGEEDGGEDPINDDDNNNDNNIIRATFQTWILYHHP